MSERDSSSVTLKKITYDGRELETRTVIGLSASAADAQQLESRTDCDREGAGCPMDVAGNSE
jgi:hypothetical protein